MKSVKVHSQSDREFLVRIITEAEEYRKSVDKNRKIEAKESDIAGDIVTNVDIAVEEFLIRKIKEEYPDFGIVSEETESANEEYGEDYFTIDPIDGTINYANDIPLWGIQMACVRGGKPVASAIFMPALGEMFSADEDGTYLNGEPVHVCSKGIADGVCDIEGHTKHAAKKQLEGVFTHMRDINSTAVALAWTSCGRLAATGYFGGDDIYNYLPGLFLVKQAGGIIHDTSDHHFAAGNQEFIDAFLKLHPNI